jgi:di/tricarboxylate transporter
MNYNLYITLAVLLVAATVLLSDRLRADVVALLVALALGLSGVLTPQETFSGFSRSAVMTIVAIFILAEGLRRTGVAERAGDLLVRVAGTGERRLVMVAMLLGAMLSLFMNNIAAASVLLPAVTSAGRESGIHPARVLMPLAFGTILGGMATLFTTTNIVSSSLLRDQGLPGFSVLDFAPVGLPLVAAGVFYMVMWGRRLLPKRRAPRPAANGHTEQSDLAEIYHLEERLFRARLQPGCSLIGQSIAESKIRESFNLNVIAIQRDGNMLPSPVPETVLQQDDVMLLEGKLQEFREQAARLPLEILPVRHWQDRDLESAGSVVVEAVLAPRSSLSGQTLRGVRFREKYAMRVLAVWRAGRPIRTGLSDLELQFGDALLLHGQREQLPLLRTEPDLVVLEKEAATAVPGKGWLALAIVVSTVALAALNSSIVAEVMLGGALAMILFGIVPMDRAYQAVEWRTVVIVAGMLPLGLAMTKTGAAALLAQALTNVLGPGAHLALLAGLLLLAVLLTQVMNGAAVAAVVVPVAIQAASQVGIDPRSLVMGVALATSMAFITPLGHPVNILVMAPGEYRFKDYVRVGLPLAAILFVLIMILLPAVWPL